LICFVLMRKQGAENPCVTGSIPVGTTKTPVNFVCRGFLILCRIK
jgi:hypothetical protein